MKKQNLAWIAGVIALLPFAYGMGATALILKTRYRITQQLDERKGIALTFDDGPHPVYTMQLLDLLKRYQIKATFFVLGQNVRQYPNVVERMHKEGHQIGIHHDRHTSSWLLTPSQLSHEIKETHRAIVNVTGESPILYRPPWGLLNAATLFVTKPYQIILWSHVFQDWKIESCKSGLLKGLRNTPAEGSIVLLHDDGTNRGADDEAPAYMLDRLSIYLEEAVAEGVEFVPVNGLKR
ncbi:polysaccharide deacetylase family protein [Sporosarcina sp. P21c]|uniref:polysaccharide deacetylase family protein n=1 Tax=unclassified Sporosarcina TaxID=2647733 RepID=UPI000C170B4E|nr:MULTISPECIES: polysaccharide deacetylase family protein [unclassified Sporosarcina]PIC68168.1 polysaccharide deacetylase family protein [Sporosarcina sp. P16a]PIC90379.1 polysaccharide deacetylase family protein [Sporosarcina sp. P21c]PIC93908.1 polysaccharide deacetylase family protein [Sporosarcina sp. P25]